METIDRFIFSGACIVIVLAVASSAAEAMKAGDYVWAMFCGGGMATFIYQAYRAWVIK